MHIDTKAVVVFRSLPHHLFPLWTLVLPCIPTDPEINQTQDGKITTIKKHTIYQL